MAVKYIFQICATFHSVHYHRSQDRRIAIRVVDSCPSLMRQLSCTQRLQISTSLPISLMQLDSMHACKDSNHLLVPLCSGGIVSLRKGKISGDIEAKSLNNQRTSIKREFYSLLTLVLIVGAFILCWLPFFILYFKTAIYGSHVEKSKTVRTFVTWLAYLNSGINPIIYTAFNADFRVAMKKIIRKRAL